MNSETKKIKLEDLGYNTFFEFGREALGLLNYSVARVIAEYKEAYRVKGLSGEYLAKMTGKQIFSASKREDYPAVGDWVAISEFSPERAVIRGILPRRTTLKKKYSDKDETQIIATNIDTAFIIESMDRDYNLNRLERYVVLANEGKIRPVIVLNKVDLISEAEIKLRIGQIKKRFHDVDVIPVSAITEQGLNALGNLISKGKTYCFLGSSGVGKSSLINKLLRKDEIKTREISNSTGRGKHTTTAREVYFMDNGGIVIDNPGTREVGIADAATGIENVFDEITALSQNCKYSDCTHVHEPGCVVLRAVKTQMVDENKYLNYVKLRREADYYRMTDRGKKEKDRRFGKFIKKAQDQLKKI